MIRDTAGHRLGWTGDQWVAEIPTGYELPQTLGDATRSYRSLYLPAGSYTVQASAGSSHQIDYSLFVDGRVLEVNSQTSSAGMIGEIAVSPGLDAIAVSQPAGLRSLLIDVTYERSTASRIAGLMGSAISGNDDLALSFDGEKMHLLAPAVAWCTDSDSSNPDAARAILSQNLSPSAPTKRTRSGPPTGMD